ncbi:MAG: CoA-binding protein [Nannocystaceae bacterium]
MSVDQFLSGESFAVVGASRDRSKFGNKVLRAYLDRDMPVVAVNPRESGEIEGATVVATLADLPTPVHGVSIITPPAVTEKVVEDAIAAGIRHLWMQPGAESPRAIRAAEEAGLSVIAGGPCILVELPRRG